MRRGVLLPLCALVLAAWWIGSALHTQPSVGPAEQTVRAELTAVAAPAKARNLWPK